LTKDRKFDKLIYFVLPNTLTNHRRLQSMDERVLFYCCRSAYQQAKGIVNGMQAALQQRRCGFFGDDELKLRIKPQGESFDFLDGSTAILFTCPRSDAQENYMETLGTIEGLAGKGVKEIIPVFTFMGYRRQDREAKLGEVPLLRMIPRLLSVYPVRDVVVGELHNPTLTREYFGEHSINIHEVLADRAFETICHALLERDDVIVASPDGGRLKVVQGAASRFGKQAIVSAKTRPEDDRSEVVLDDIDLSGKHVLVRDDEVNTFGTMDKNTVQYRKKGATEITGFSAHGVLSGDAVDLIQDSGMDRVYVSDTITFPYEKGDRDDVSKEERELGIQFRSGKIYRYTVVPDFVSMLGTVLQGKNLL
jgi:ribose-phosphate pyrophosphokinase